MSINNILDKDLNNITSEDLISSIKYLSNRLLIELSKSDKSGIYGYTQRHLAYNSNRIEGSTLTEEQTASLFETHSIYSDVIIKSKDIEEMNGHFVMFNKMLQKLDEPLSESIIKELHYELKNGVFEDKANGYNIGEYKSRANMVSTIKTSSPADVEAHMRDLLDWYNSVDISISTLAIFHSRYEKIHPFQDGNGRTGRVLLFRECLKNNIIPFIIEDSMQSEYNKALNKAQNDEDFEDLVNIFKTCQNLYFDIMKEFLREFEHPLLRASKTAFDK